MVTSTDAVSKVAAREDEPFTGIPNCVLTSPETRSLSHAGFRVLVCLYEHFNHEHGAAWPSHATMAAATGMSLRSVGRAVEEVIASGLWQRVSGRGGRRVSVYRPATAFRSATDDRSGSADQPSMADQGSADQPGMTDQERRSANCDSLIGQKTSPDRTPVANEQQENNTKNKKRGRAHRRSDAPLRALTDRFSELWRQRNGENGQKYPFGGAKDAQAAKRILAAVGGDLDAVEPIFRRFFDDDSEFHRGHSLAKLSSDLARFMEKPAPPRRRTGSARLRIT